MELRDTGMFETQLYTKFISAFAVTALLLLLTSAPGPLAHDDSLPGNGQIPLHARDIMKAFAEEHHHNQYLAAQSITTCTGGVAGTYPCSNIDLMAFLPLAQIGGGNGNDIWGWTDSTTGKEYAIMGLTNGTAFVDISDPVNPVYLGHLPPHTGVSGSSWRDIKTFNDHAFIGSEALNSGMQVVDLTQLRSIASPPVTLVETAFYLGFSSSHNIVINEDSGYAYGVGVNNGNCGGGLHFVDILNATNPLAAGCYSADGYTHDAQCVNYIGPDIDHQGKEICFAYNEDTLTVVDVSNKSSPTQISRTGYFEFGYTHQGWLSEDQAYLLMDDETDERNLGGPTRTLMWDVRDLDAPVYMGYHSGAASSIDHNQYILGDYSYQANYRSGLRILDISDIANGNLTEAAFFDVYPSSDSTNFNGAWSVYPYFASGNVIVSGIEQGLFILRPNLSAPSDPPVVHILNPVNNDPSPLSGVVQIQIDATDTEDTAGTLTVEWTVDGGSWQSTSYASPNYVANWDTATVLDGAHVIIARAVDSDLREGSDNSNVSTANGTPQFTVDSINVSIIIGKGNRNTGDVIVFVTDAAFSPLDDVAVEGTFSGAWNGTRNGTTDFSGLATFKTPKVKNMSFVQFCIDLASKAGWEFDLSGSTLCADSSGGGSQFGNVAGNITDAASSADITNAAVSVDTGQLDTTNSFGEYSIANVPVGTRNVSVTASGYEGQNISTSVTDGVTSTVDFALNETTTSGFGSIKGAVYSGAGGKVQGVTLQVLGGTSSVTNKGGKFTIQNVPADLQTVVATKSGFLSQQQYVTVIAGSHVTLNFTLAPE